MKSSDLLEIIGEADDRFIEEAENVSETIYSKKRRYVRLIWAAAACIALIAAVGFTVYAVAENKEYREALNYLEDYGFSTEGMSRAEIKETWRKFTVSNKSREADDDDDEDGIKDAVIKGHELILCTEEEAQAAILYCKNNPGSEHIQNTPISPYAECYYDEHGRAYDNHDYYEEGKTVVGKYEGDKWLWRTDVSPLEYTLIYEWGKNVIVTGITNWSNELASVLCLSGETGQILWRTSFIPDAATSVLPMAALTDDDGVTVFCRTVHGDGARLSKKYRLVAVRLNKSGELIGEYQSDIRDLFTIQGVKELSEGYFILLKNLSEDESGEKYPYEFIYMDGSYKIRNNCRLTIGEMLSEYETPNGNEYSQQNSTERAANIGSPSSLLTINVIEECNGLIWMCGSVSDILDLRYYEGENAKAEEKESSSEPFGAMYGLDDPVIKRIRKNCAAYVIAWDPLSGEVKYFCTAPGCFGNSIHTNENGDVTWTVFSVVGCRPVRAAMSSMRAFLTTAVFENVFSSDLRISSQYVGGAVIRY